MVAFTGSIATINDRALQESFLLFAARLPSPTCRAFHYFEAKECRDLKTVHGMNGRVGPLLFISDQNPFNREPVDKYAIIELGGLPSPDDVRTVLSTIAEQTHNGDLVKQAKKGELVRRIERAFEKYGGPVKDCIHLFGFG